MGKDLGQAKFTLSHTTALKTVVRDAPGANAPELQKYKYDELGRVLTATRFNLDASQAITAGDRAVTTTRTYDDVRRRYTEETGVGRFQQRKVQTEWSVSGASWTRSTLLPDGRTVATTFDGQGRAQQLQRANGGTTDFTWLDEEASEPNLTLEPGQALRGTTR